MDRYQPDHGAPLSVYHRRYDRPNRSPSRTRKDRTQTTKGRHRRGRSRSLSRSRIDTSTQLPYPNPPSPSEGRRPEAYTDSYHRRERHRNNSIDVSLPKNFKIPLTCFFWYFNGRCNKRDEDCAYAHWNTGHFAGAPISIPTANGVESVAGKKARDFTSELPRPSVYALEEREEAIKVKEQELESRERNVEKREEDLEKTTRLREKEFRLREKRLTRKEEALRHANSSPQT
ncbi:hypothetical protein BS50DRAFT_480612 [Corynespora cassiicola Philippines]|uniref:C3H1-type domain-containing protein n=1 Tax=Corynespora cassiicola Philippines TaxID=1448308 RepID=A0A2T2PAU5_CORCC|nr:hypothetical protein BS50DRAFT_480612 [Corynespora cassiicola Philippines]